jgi:hypothetical protein
MLGQHLAQGLHHPALQVRAGAAGFPSFCGFLGWVQNCGHGGFTFRNIDWV